MEDLKAIWNIELQILKEVDRICKKYNITYYADSGTLLGAIRHNGFIPWDDDIDIAMFRKDFNKFRKIAKKEFGKLLFCQSGYNDKGFYGGMLHIRMNGTTAILKNNYPHTKYNQGIFIDIFPLDGVIENSFLLKVQHFFINAINSVMWYKNCGRKRLFKPKHLILLIPSLLPQRLLFAIFESVCSWKKTEKSDRVDVISYFGTSGVGKRKVSWYKKVEKYDFANTTIPVPGDYKEVLTCMYGADYMIPKKSSSDHGEVFFDINHSYKDYLNGKLVIPEEYINKWQNQ